VSSSLVVPSGSGNGFLERRKTARKTTYVGSSNEWRAVLGRAMKVAPTDTTVLVTGESGTGKEVVARLIHNESRRNNGPFVALNCAALPETLLESELFGHERGAFTGALSARPGRIEQAARGTLFLDEIGEMTPAAQAKLLRVLEEREFQRVGGVRTLKADVRILAATNRDLRKAIAAGQFREDLYYRLVVFEIPIEPLRKRAEDVLALCEYFLEDRARMMGRSAAGITLEARQRLRAYRWPGNVRELRNVIERALILCDGDAIDVEHLHLQPDDDYRAPEPGGEIPQNSHDLESIERAAIQRVIEKTGGNKSRAARMLGLSRKQLYNRIRRFGLEEIATS
jgi:transcriptional regulator with PAS, ATPase and Fis domain